MVGVQVFRARKTDLVGFCQQRVYKTGTSSAVVTPQFLCLRLLCWLPSSGQHACPHGCQCSILVPGGVTAFGALERTYLVGFCQQRVHEAGASAAVVSPQLLRLCLLRWLPSSEQYAC